MIISKIVNKVDIISMETSDILGKIILTVKWIYIKYQIPPW